MNHFETNYKTFNIFSFFSYKTIIFIFVSVLLISSVYFLKNDKYDVDLKKLVIADQIIKIKIADSNEERIKGLSNTEKLDEDSGLWFIFDKEDYYGIWMNDMNYSIDVIWVDKNRRVVHFEQNLSPETYPKVFKPKNKALYILEINAGLIKKSGIKIGDEINII